nr:hypothetical protein [Tanacetum cinerariifolium]
MGSKDLWELCDQHGTVANVYIARKLSKIGRRFAFVRFLKVKNSKSLIEELNKIRIGSYYLFVTMARFDRKPNATPKSIPKPSNNHPSNQPKSASFPSHANPNQSYVTALNGKTPQNFKSNERSILKSVTLDATDLLDTSDMRNMIFAKVRDVHLILNINNFFKKEGFYDFQCKYIGGMWLWIEFDSSENCQKLQSNKEMSSYFTLMKHVTQSFKTDLTVVWIEIRGLPLHAWTTKAYKKLLEFVGWVPNIKTIESLSSENSKTDNFDNHDHDIDNNGFHDIEEGEIRNVNVNQEEEVIKDTQWKHQNFKQPSTSSVAPAKISRVSKSHSKSSNNHGSMVEAFTSYIEIGNILGYDMEGSKIDLKKFIDSLGAKQGQ